MSSLSQEDTETLQAIGHSIVQTTVALVVESVMWTIYLVCVIIAGRILLRKGHSKTSVAMFLVIFTMFLLDTAMCILDVHNAIREVTLTLTSTSPLSLTDRYALTDNLPFAVTNSLFAYMSTLGDVVIIWRAYTFWCNGRERLVMIIPAISLLGSFTASGLVSFCVAQIVHENASGQFLNPPFCRNIQRTLYCMTAATTATATTLILYKTWLYRRNIGSGLRSFSNKTRAEKIMLVLIESSLLYFLFSLVFIIDDSGNIPQEEVSTLEFTFATTIWTYMTSHIIGIYPAIMVILVHSQRSYLDQTMISTHLRSTTDYTNSTNGSRNALPSSHKKHPGTHTIEIGVHEAFEMDGAGARMSRSSRSLPPDTSSTGTGEEWTEKKTSEKPPAIV